jgi:hypothetical protein
LNLDGATHARVMLISGLTVLGYVVVVYLIFFDARTHLSLNKDCPPPRRVQLPSAGNIIAFPEVGGLHHRYERRAA